MLDIETTMPPNRKKLAIVAMELAARIEAAADPEPVDEEFSLNLGCSTKNDAFFDLMNNLTRATYAAEQTLRTALEAVASAVDGVEEADKCQHALMALTGHPDEGIDDRRPTAAL